METSINGELSFIKPFEGVFFNKRSFSLQFISYIICQASIRILKAKVLLLALPVHDSCFKMLGKKFFS